jgi:hypothetical protein
MLDHYLGTAQLAAVLLDPRAPRPAPPPDVTFEPLTDQRDAFGWFTAEHRVLLGVIALCHRPGEVDPAGGGSHPLAPHRRTISRYLRSSEAFRYPADPYREASILQMLGDAYLACGDGASAARVWREALAVLESLGHTDTDQVRAKIHALPATGGSPSGLELP